MDDAGSNEPDIWELIAQAEQGKFTYPIQGSEWEGWWTGRIPEDRQVFVVLTGRRDLPPEEPIELFGVVFDAAGTVVERFNLRDPMKIKPWEIDAEDYRDFEGAEFDEWLAKRFGSFERACIRVKNFSINEIRFYHQSMPISYLDGDVDEVAVRAWIKNERSVILFGKAYWLGREGQVTDT